MKALTTTGLTKLIELVKSSFINKTDVETVSEVNLATVATTGSYNDLSNKPTIPTVPTNVSAFTNDSNYQTGTQVSSDISTHNSSSSAHSDIRTALNGKATDSNTVHKSGNETISGVKTFTSGNEPIKVGNVEIVDGQQSYKDISYYDTDGKRVAGLRAEHSTDNSRRANLYVCTADNTNKGGITVMTDGTTLRVTAPTPAVNSNDTQIATTAYINNKFQLVSALPTSPDANVWYAIPE